MGRRTGYDAGSYDQAIQLLSQACFKRHPDATSADFMDAVSFAIGDSVHERSSTILVLLSVLDQTDWLFDQTEIDIFIGRYVREFAALSRKGKARGLAGIDLCEVETLPRLFPPRSQRDQERANNEQSFLKSASHGRPCIPLLDEALDTSSPLFESVRMVMSEQDPEKSARYLSSFVRYMLSQGESDPMIARRLRVALMSPRKTTRKQGEARK